MSNYLRKLQRKPPAKSEMSEPIQVKVSPNSKCPCGSQRKFSSCHMRGQIVPDPAPNGMYFEWIGGVRLYRPRANAEKSIRDKTEAHLLQTFEPGTYTDIQDTQKILHSLVDYYGSNLDERVAELACRSFMEFLLDQYERCGELEDRRKKNQLSGQRH